MMMMMILMAVCVDIRILLFSKYCKVQRVKIFLRAPMKKCTLHFKTNESSLI